MAAADQRRLEACKRYSFRLWMPQEYAMALRVVRTAMRVSKVRHCSDRAAAESCTGIAPPQGDRTLPMPQSSSRNASPRFLCVSQSDLLVDIRINHQPVTLKPDSTAWTVMNWGCVGPSAEQHAQSARSLR